jgi:hypothetical protein
VRSVKKRAAFSGPLTTTHSYRFCTLSSWNLTQLGIQLHRITELQLRIFHLGHSNCYSVFRKSRSEYSRHGFPSAFHTCSWCLQNYSLMWPFRIIHRTHSSLFRDDWLSVEPATSPRTKRCNTIQSDNTLGLLHKLQKSL